MQNAHESAPKHSMFQAWMVCMVAALYFFYIFIQMTKFNAIGHDLMMDFKIGATGLGTLSSIYFWGNVIFLLPAGLILDRVSVKKVLFAVMVISIIFTYLFSYTNTVATASWCFLFIGLAGAFALIIPLRLIARWFPGSKMALASGMAVTIGFTGAMISQSPLTWLVNLVGWRHAMQYDALMGIGLLILMMLVVKDYPKGAAKVVMADAATLKSLGRSLKKALGNSQNWLFGIYTCLVNLPMFVFGAAFGVPFLEQIHKVTEEQAAFAMLLLFLGAMAGSPAFGWLSDKMKLRKAPMFIGAIVSLILLLIPMYIMGLNYLALYVIFFAIGVFTSSQVITYAVIPESNSDEYIGTSLALGSMLIMSGGAIFMPVFGWLLDLYWSGKIVNKVPVHALSDYRFALWLLPISIAVAIVAIIIGKETHCKKLKLK
jgi:predicted MFS family arabinose efflux permease